MKKFLALIPLLCLSSGCSKLDFALYWADTFVLSYVTDYFELGFSEKKEFKKQFNLTLDEIRKTEFPKLVRILGDTVKLAESGDITPLQLEAQIKEVQALMKSATANFEPLAQSLVARQSTLGFKRFDEEFEDKFKSDLEKASDPKQAKKNQRKLIEKWVDESIEYLTDVQEKDLETFLEANPSPTLLRLENKRKVYEAFKIARMEESTRTEFLKQYFGSWPLFRSEEYRLAQAQYQEKLIKWICELARTLNEKQKKNLLENLNHRIQEFKKASPT